MSAIIGSLIGFGSSVIPAIVDGLKQRQDHKFELQKMEKAAELRKAGYDHEIKMYQEMGADKEHQRLIEHDIAISKMQGWIGALQRSVRPVITYFYFAIFAAIEITLLYHAVDTGMGLQESLELLWDDETQATFAAIISFWFGSRAIDKTRNVRPLA